MLTLHFAIPEALLAPLEAEIDGVWLERLALDLDAVLFGPQGGIARRIAGQDFEPLNADYKAAKDRQGLDVRIWVRTGELLELVLREGNAGRKHVRLHISSLLAGRGMLWEAELDLPYVVYADRARPLLHFTERERAAAAEVVHDALNELLVRRLGA